MNNFNIRQIYKKQRKDMPLAFILKGFLLKSLLYFGAATAQQI